MNMHLLVLGAGEVGRNIAFAAAKQPSVTNITVADRNIDAARHAAHDIKAGAVEVDVSDEQAMSKLLASVDIVGSSVGPATRFGVPILRQAIAAGKAFVDVCDDPEPTLEMLGLDKQAKAAGVTAIVGCGASPGISNLLAVEAASRLEGVDRIITSWGEGDDSDDSGISGVSAAVEHWVEQISFPIPVWREGALRHVVPLEHVEVFYPGVGKVIARSVGHPEAVTLPRRFTDVRECVNAMDFSSYVFVALERVAEQVRSKKKTIREGAEMLARMLGKGEEGLTFGDAAAYAVNTSKDVLSGKLSLPGLCAVAEGVRGGRKTIIGASLNGYIPGGMGPVTAVPAAIGIEMIASRTVEWSGVRAPEDALEPHGFFDLLRKHMLNLEGRPLTADEKTVIVVEDVV
jgi:saccharopine dehydrogenase-like NADP-dependent oxidoreductase